MTEATSLLSLAGYQSHSCGYCAPPGQRNASNSSHSVGVTSLFLTCDHYQKMIDRGWRRSGDYCYKPDMRRTCCPQYTIKLDARAFKATRNHRKGIYRWNRYILEGIGDSEDDSMDVTDGTGKTKKSKKAPPFSLLDSIHASESAFCLCETSSKHKFEIVIEPASYTKEKFDLYRHYQRNVHREERKAHTPASFRRFLVDSPLSTSPIEYEKTPPDHLPKKYGSYHILYRVDGELVAMGVNDILPNCVSSVYFMYNIKWEKFSLGKYSALREVALVQEMHDYGAKEMKYVYLGYYIHSCQKMRYKGEYSPSFLLDPEEYTWYPLKDCVPLLDEYRYACFSCPEHSLKEANIPPRAEPADVSDEDLSQIKLYHKNIGTLPLSMTNMPGNPFLRKHFLEAIEGLGIDLAKQVVLTIG